jgi:hypothetical protein
LIPVKSCWAVVFISVKVGVGLVFQPGFGKGLNLSYDGVLTLFLPSKGGDFASVPLFLES